MWLPLFSAIEQRWRERFGSAQIDQLRQSLSALVNQLDVDLPDCLPILNYGLFTTLPNPQPLSAENAANLSADLPLSALLSKVLLAFALEFERESDLSLAISANVVRVLDEKSVLIRDLPLLTGVSKASINTSLNYLQKQGFVIIETVPATGRGKQVRLTQKGQTAQNSYQYRVGVIERRWQARFSKNLILVLKDALTALDSAPDVQKPPLFRGLQPYPDGWRAFVGRPEVLPDYPMVLHRGGFPDGS